MALSSVVLSGFLRIVTHPKIFKNPSLLEEAIAFCEIMRACPNLIFIEPSKRHWEIFCDLFSQVKPKGNGTPDIWLAALAIEHHCHWITLDKGFLKYPGLHVKSP